MDYSNLPQDDLLDVLEMTKKVDAFLSDTFSQTDRNLAMSAVMNSTINCIIAQCRTLEDVMFYRSIFLHFFDASINAIKIKED